MCGLVGIISKRTVGFYSKETDIFTQMLYADALRGFDATGVMGINKYGNVTIKKQAVSANYFTKTSQYRDFEKDITNKYHMVIGHNRYATKGSKESKDAHPFWDKNNKICLVHNGTITNQKEFCKEADVDSAAIANALAERDPKDVIENIEGAFALIWYDIDEKKMFFIRNDARPLYIAENNDIYAIASEMDMMTWIGSRNGTKYSVIHNCQPYKLYSIDIEKKEFKEVEEFKKKQSFPITTYTGVTGTTMDVTTREYMSQIHQVTGLANVEPSPALFLSDSDLPTVQAAMQLLSRGEKLNFLVDGYIKKDKNVCIEGSIANISNPHIKLKWWATESMFDLLDLTNIYEVQILSMIIQEKDLVIYCNRGEEQETTQSYNGKFITSNMWMGSCFYNECDGCDKIIGWKDIPKCNIEFVDMSVNLFTCPECTEHDEKNSSCPV